MKTYSFLLLFCLLARTSAAQSTVPFQIFTCIAPAGFRLEEKENKLFYQLTEGSSYCQLYLWPAISGQADVEKDFARDWESFANKPYQLKTPETREKQQADDWQVINGAARGRYNDIQFVISISTFTNSKANITYCIVGVMNDGKYLSSLQQFTASVSPDLQKFNTGKAVTKIPASMTGLSKPSTRFNDGWTAVAMNDYVQVTKGNTEIRLQYPDNTLDDARSNMIQPTDYYWKACVEQDFSFRETQKWSGVEYPVIYFMQGKGINKKTGASCFVALKIVYSGGARPIVVITSDQQTYERQFSHPNQLDAMLSYNKFAITEKDLLGSWKGGGGGGLEFYNAYTGNFLSSHTISSTDEFTFNSNGTYSSLYRAANINGGQAQFGGQDFRGRFSCSDWQLTATNRYKGATTRFEAQFIAVKGGHLLFLQDPDNRSMQYTLYRSK